MSEEGEDAVTITGKGGLSRLSSYRGLQYLAHSCIVAYRGPHAHITENRKVGRKGIVDFSIPDGHSGKADSRGRDGHGILFSAGIHVHQGQVYAFYGRAHGGNVELDRDIVPKMEFIPVRDGYLARYLPCPVKIPHTTHSTDSVVLVKHMDTISVHRVSPAYLDGLSGSLLAAKLTSREIGTARIFTIGSPVAGWLQGGQYLL